MKPPSRNQAIGLSFKPRNKKLIRLNNHDHHLHFIGIGGAGMSPLALIMANRGYSVSGSDQITGNGLKELAEQGINVFPGQSARNITCLGRETNKTIIVVISTAIPEENPELKAAKETKTTIWHRSDLLAVLISSQDSVAIAGSHGKTTTSTFLTTLLKKSGEGPTAVVGGKVPCIKKHEYSGKGKLLIAEADESDGTLIKFKPELGVITNIDLDHTDYYPNIDSLIKTMTIFGDNCKELLVNYDCPNLKNTFPNAKSWSIKTIENINYSAIPIKIESNKITAKIYEEGEEIGTILMPIPGIHNLSNAIAAIAVCRLKNIKFKKIKNIISELSFPARRFEFRGTWQDRYIVDDYAHHPTEIKNTLSMAKIMLVKDQTFFPKQPERLFVVFQPHRYSRTKIFLHDFADSMEEADAIILAPIYSAGENKIKDIDINQIGKLIKTKHPNIEVYLADSLQNVTELINTFSKKNDLIACIGAGDINTIWERLQDLQNPKEWTSKTFAA